MAYRTENIQQGYDERRFESSIRQDLLCSICHEVLRDPRTCQNKEHPFCLSCISQHLGKSSTCPACREHLTPETLKNPPRFLKNTLSELKINCDYHERGCPSYLQLGNLQSHVDECGFAPVMCANEGCGTEINKKDKDYHEKNFCYFNRIAKCHDCKDIKASQDEMKASQDKMEVEINKTKAHITGIERKQDEIKENVEEMKVELNKTKAQIAEMEKKRDQVNVNVNRMKENVNEIKLIQAEMKADQVVFEAEVKQQFETVTAMLNQLLRGTNVNNNGAQAVVPANNQDIIILGGLYGPEEDDILNTVENYNRVEGKSTLLPRMNYPRAASASCIYNNDVIIAGGDREDEYAGSDTMEVLKMNNLPLQWTMFDGKLPAKLQDHVVIVHQDNLYVIGGYNWTEGRPSDAIYKVYLKPPYTSELLARMPQPRCNHGAELVNGKLFILGGSETSVSRHTLDSVLEYDFLKKTFKSCAPLPQPVWVISTVTWGNMIIVIGGMDGDGQVLNDVIMYDTENGRIEKLPSMVYKRSGCSAAITHDVIVVFGGRNKLGLLNSVESFTLGSDGWRELPGMKEKRHFATAVVKPRN